MKRSNSRRVALLGVLAALAMTLSFVEMLLPPLPMLPPGFKIGLSNIAVMYGLFVGGLWYGIILAVIKSFFILFVNGGYAFILSLCGSVCAVSVMALVVKLFKTRASYTAISVTGALFHNGAQLLMVYIITATNAAFYYLPLLIIAAVVCGVLTAAIVKLAMPIIINSQKQM